MAANHPYPDAKDSDDVEYGRKWWDSRIKCADVIGELIKKNPLHTRPSFEAALKPAVHSGARVVGLEVWPWHAQDFRGLRPTTGILKEHKSIDVLRSCVFGPLAYLANKPEPAPVLGFQVGLIPILTDEQLIEEAVGWRRRFITILCVGTISSGLG